MERKQPFQTFFQKPLDKQGKQGYNAIKPTNNVG